MIEWWNNLNDIQRFFAYIALPATFISVIQTILLLLGFIDFDTDIDLDEIDIDIDLDEIVGLKFFSIKGIIAFCTFFGWVGVALAEQGLSKYIVFIVALLSGFLAMFLMAALFYFMTKLQSKGNVDYNNAIGKDGDVYLVIPAKRSGYGKITVLIQERLVEVNAVTDEEESIPTGAKVRVIDVLTSNIVLVVPEQKFNIIK